MELLKARGEPTPMLYGWGGALLVIDQVNAQDCFFDLVDFAKNQWSDMYTDLDGQRVSFEATATASDVPEFPMARSRETTKGREGLKRKGEGKAAARVPASGRQDGRIVDGPDGGGWNDPWPSSGATSSSTPAAMRQPDASTTVAADRTPSGGSVPEPREPPLP